MQKSKNHFNVKILTDSSCVHSKGSQPKYKVQRTKMEKQNPKNDSKWENLKKKSTQTTNFNLKPKTQTQKLNKQQKDRQKRA